MSPELSIAFEPDEGLDEWTEDVFENQLRFPLSHWPSETDSYWTDVVSGVCVCGGGGGMYICMFLCGCGCGWRRSQ